MIGSPSIRRLEPADVSALADFFRSLVSHGDQRYFHPHDLDQGGAENACQKANPDYFCAGFLKNSLVAYGMLRGWSEGFAIPSLGLAVHPDFRNQGWGRHILDHLHQVAIARNCQKIRLTAYRKNSKAIRLFLQAGYRLELDANDRAVAWLDLCPGSATPTL